MNTPWTRGAWLILAVALGTLTSLGADPTDPESPERRALRALQRGDHARAHETIEAELRATSPGAPRNRRLRLLRLAHHTLDPDSPLDPAELDALTASVHPDDLAWVDTLFDLVPPERRAPLRHIRRAVYDAIGPDLPRQTLIRLTFSEDPTARQRALDALGRQLAQLRRRVWEGGRLTPDQELALSDPELIQRMIELLPERLPSLPTVPGAWLAERSGDVQPVHILELIEAPALDPLDDAAQRGWPGALVARGVVERAMALRLSRYPDSSWSDARGTLPRPLQTLRCPAPCGTHVPQGARHCTTCGAPVRTPCAACGHLFPTDADTCTHCGRASDPDLQGQCPRCHAPTLWEHAHCAQCGLRLPQ